LAKQKRLFVPDRVLREFVKNRPSEIQKVYNELKKHSKTPGPRVAQLGQQVLFPPDLLYSFVAEVELLNKAIDSYNNKRLPVASYVRCNEFPPERHSVHTLVRS
jgi:hypothetical protein